MDKPDQIRHFLQSFSKFADADIEEFLHTGKPTYLNKGEYFIREGEICKSFAFTHQGVFSFLIFTDQQEHVKDFTGSQKLLTAYTSFITQTPSKIFIRAEADAELTEWSHQSFLHLIDTYESWKEFAMKMANYLYFRKEKREISLLTESAEERYLHMQREFAEIDIVQELPQYLIASYLGIRPQSLSRIRQNMATIKRS